MPPLRAVVRRKEESKGIRSISRTPYRPHGVASRQEEDHCGCYQILWATAKKTIMKRDSLLFPCTVCSSSGSLDARGGCQVSYPLQECPIIQHRPSRSAWNGALWASPGELRKSSFCRPGVAIMSIKGNHPVHTPVFFLPPGFLGSTGRQTAHHQAARLATLWADGCPDGPPFEAGGLLPPSAYRRYRTVPFQATSPTARRSTRRACSCVPCSVQGGQPPLSTRCSPLEPRPSRHL